MKSTYAPLDRARLDEMVIASTLDDDITPPVAAAGSREFDSLFRDVSFRAVRRRLGHLEFVGRYECTARLRDDYWFLDPARLAPALMYLLGAPGTPGRLLIRERVALEPWVGGRQWTYMLYDITMPGTVPVRASLDFPPPAGVADDELRQLAPYVRRTLAFLHTVTYRDV
jgi:hypothetical protein